MKKTENSKFKNYWLFFIITVKRFTIMSQNQDPPAPVKTESPPQNVLLQDNLTHRGHVQAIYKYVLNICTKC